MHFLPTLLTGAVILASASARHIPRDLDARSDVDTCKAILIALKASAFCSSFVPITDTTSTVTQTGTSVSTQVTEYAPCTNAFKKNKKRQLSTTPAAPSTTPAAPSTTRAISTTPAAPSTTPAAPSTTRAISTTPAAPSTTPATTRAISTTPAAPSTTPKITTTTSATTTSANCPLKGVPSAIAIFACEVIDDACLAFVKPKTKTVTTFTPGPTSTGTKTITPTCPITTTRNRDPSTTP